MSTRINSSPLIVDSIILNGNTISSTTDNTPIIATKSYADATVQGLKIKSTATVATTTTLPANTYANGALGVGATLTANAVGVLTVDTYSTLLNDIILVKNETTSANNGLYIVTTQGTAGIPYVLTRTTDMDLAAEFSGAFIPVGNLGTTNANTLWLANPVTPVIVGTTAIPFTQLNGATSLIPGTGIDIVGNIISIINTYAGQASIVTTGTLTSGATGAGFTINLTTSTITGTLTGTHGGTDQSVYAIGDILSADTTTHLSKISDIATGNVLLSGGVSTLPSYGKVGLTTHISGTLPIANGGTSLSTLGTTLQQLRVNAGATALEYFTPSASWLPPIVRYVYLVNDATDVTREGGITNNCYSTFQSAYTAAVAVWVALGSVVGTKVAMVVGVTTAAVVGDVTLTANWNADIIIVGQGKSNSVLGNIISNNASGNAFTVVLTAFTCTIGTITAQATGATGNGGVVTLTGELVCGNISTICSNGANTTGVGGAVSLDAILGKCSSGTITTTGGTTGIAGAVTINNGWVSGAVTTSGGTTAAAGNITISNLSQVTGAITTVHNGAGTVAIAITKSTITTIAVTQGTTCTGKVTTSITQFSTYTTITLTINGGTGDPTLTISNCSGTSIAYTLGTASPVSTSMNINSSFQTGAIVINNNGTTNSAITVISMTSSTISSLQYAGTVNSTSSFILWNSVFTSTNASNNTKSISLRAGTSGSLAGIDLEAASCIFQNTFLSVLSGVLNLELKEVTTFGTVSIVLADATHQAQDITETISGCEGINVTITATASGVNTGANSLTITDSYASSITYNGSGVDLLSLKIFDCALDAISLNNISLLTFNYNSACLTDNTATIDYSTVASRVNNSSPDLNV